MRLRDLRGGRAGGHDDDRQPQHARRAGLRLRRLADRGQPVVAGGSPQAGHLAHHAARRPSGHGHRSCVAGHCRAGLGRDLRMAYRGDADHEAWRSHFLRGLCRPASTRSSRCRAPTTLPSALRSTSPSAASPTRVLQPERRLFTVQRRQVAETAIQTNFLRDFYATLGEGDPQSWLGDPPLSQPARAVDLAGGGLYGVRWLRLAVAIAD